jgi:hypothetical protein
VASKRQKLEHRVMRSGRAIRTNEMHHNL